MEISELLSVAELFYDGIFGSPIWTLGLTRLAQLASSDAASLVLLDSATGSAMINEQVGLPTGLMLDYQRHYHLTDPGLAFAEKIQPGNWYIDERDLGASNIQRSDFYQDFLKPHALDSTMATSLIRSSGVNGFLSLSARAGQRDMPRIASALAPLLPHLERAIRLRIQFGQATEKSELSAYVLDQVRFALILLNCDKKVLLANRLGQQWLSHPDNPLDSRSPDADKLSALLRTACGMDGARRAASMAMNTSDGRRLSLTVVPLPEAALSGWQSGPPKALLWINDPREVEPAAGSLLQHVFGLTAAEIRLTRLLLQGLTLKEATNISDLSLETGRTQLKAIFLKLGIRRQTELHRLLGRLNVMDISG